MQIISCCQVIPFINNTIKGNIYPNQLCTAWYCLIFIHRPESFGPAFRSFISYTECVRGLTIHGPVASGIDTHTLHVQGV